MGTGLSVSCLFAYLASDCVLIVQPGERVILVAAQAALQAVMELDAPV